MNGKACIICYEKNRLVWTYRELKKGTKTYKYKILDEEDEVKALKKAELIYYDQLKEKSIADYQINLLINEWISIKEKKQQSGLIKQATVRSVRTSLKSILKVYLTKEKSIKYISEIKKDTFIDFINWRVYKSSNLINKYTVKKNIELSSVNIDLNIIKDWFKNYLLPNGYINFIPDFKNIKPKTNLVVSNRHIILRDWHIIKKYYDNWPNDTINRSNQVRTEYFRKMIRMFILFSYSFGARPIELLGNIEKKTVYKDKIGWNLEESIIGGLRWMDINIEHKEYMELIDKIKELFKALLYIKNYNDGNFRIISSNIGKEILVWKKYCNNFRKNQLLSILKENEYVFFNPFTNRPYPYSQIKKSWNEMRNKLFNTKNLNKDKNYTIYSLRTSFIINQIKSGMNMYEIHESTGVSLNLLKKYYQIYDI